MRQRDRSRPAGADDAITGAAQRRVNAQNRLRDGRRVAGDGGNNSARRFAGDAFLHLFKLAQRDSHAEILPAQRRLKKQKRRDAFTAASVGGTSSMILLVLVGAAIRAV